MSTKNTHPVNVSHLVFGLVFLGIAATWALRQADVVEADGLRWILPLVLLVAGGAGLVASVAKGITRTRASDQGTLWPDEPTTPDERDVDRL